MRHQDIREGAKLRLKREAEERYGLTGTFEVWGLQFKPGYKTPWVMVKSRRPEGGTLWFKPSDFAGVAL